MGNSMRGDWLSPTRSNRPGCPRESPPPNLLAGPPSRVSCSTSMKPSPRNKNRRQELATDEHRWTQIKINPYLVLISVYLCSFVANCQLLLRGTTNEAS